MVFALSWITIGSISMFVLVELARMIGSGLPSVRNGLITGIAIVSLFWMMPDILTNGRNVKELVGYGNCRLPIPMFNVVMSFGLILGAVPIFAYRVAFLPHIKEMGIPLSATAISFMSLWAFVLISFMISWLFGWIVTNPE